MTVKEVADDAMQRLSWHRRVRWKDPPMLIKELFNQFLSDQLEVDPIVKTKMR
jgi:hypothetical protein